MLNHYGDLFKPNRRDEWDSNTSDMPFGEWLRQSRTPAGMDTHEQDLAHAIERRTQDINRAAQAEMDRYLSSPFFRHGANPYGRPRQPNGGG